MDYTLLVGALGAVGGAVLTTAANWMNRTWQNKDKKREQAEVRAETSRKELHTAYASFFSAMTKFVHVGQRLVSFTGMVMDELVADIEFASEQRRQGTPEGKVMSSKTPIKKGLHEIANRWVLDFISAREDVEVKADALLFLEQDAVRSKAIELLTDWEVSLASVDSDSDLLANVDIDKVRAEHKRFSDDVASLRSAAAAFRRTLSGVLSSERWHDPEIARRRLLGP